MSRMSNLINGFVPKEKKVFVEKTQKTELDNIFEKLRSYAENGLTTLCEKLEELGNELEKDQDCKALTEKTTKETADSAAECTREEFEERAKAAAWSCKPSEKEIVDHQNQCQKHKFESIDIVEDYGLNFNTGNALEYILNAGHINGYVQDLQKAIWYLNRELSSNKSISKGL